MKTTLFALLLALMMDGCTNNKATQISSPNKNIRLDFCLTPDGDMRYHVAVNDTAFILPSLLGLKHGPWMSVMGQLLQMPNGILILRQTIT